MTIWERWLQRERRLIGYAGFQHFEYIEQPTQRQRVEETLARLVHTYHTRSRADLNLLSVLGYPQTRNVIMGDQRPVRATTRRAHFGEILACEFVREHLGYEFPMFRLRFNPNPDQSMKGDDILGFAVQPSMAVLVGEAKYRTKYSSETVLEAQRALENGFRPYPASIEFVITVLELQGERDSADRVRQIKNRLDSGSETVEVAHLLFIVTQGRPRDPFGCIEENCTIPNLVAVNVALGTGAGAWIDRLFERQIGTRSIRN